MTRRKLIVILIAALIGVVVLFAALPDPPAGYRGEESTPRPSPSASTRVIVREVPGPVVEKTIESPVNAACQNVGELAVAVHEAVLNYEKEIGPYDIAMDEGHKAIAMKDIKGINDAKVKMWRSIERSHDAAQDLATAQSDLRKALATCQAR